jgi:hypothetical protein
LVVVPTARTEYQIEIHSSYRVMRIYKTSLSRKETKGLKKSEVFLALLKKYVRIRLDL